MKRINQKDVRGAETAVRGTAAYGKKGICGRAVPGILAALLLAAALAGCGASKSSSGTGNYMVAETAAATTAAAAYAKQSYKPSPAPEAPMAMDSALADEAYETEGGYGAGGSSASAANGSGGPDVDVSGSDEVTQSVSRKLIRNVDLMAQTTEYEAVIENLKKRITELGGYIEFMGEYGGDYYNRNSTRHTSLTARIPVEKLDVFLNTAFEKAVITSRTESTEDITLRYTDLEAHRYALRTEQDKLTELIAQADSVEAIIAIESRLSEIRYEIESIERSLRSYDNRVTYSTVSINIDEVKVVEPGAKATIWQRIARGISSGFEDLGENIADFIIGLVILIPFLLILAVIAIVVYTIVRKLLKKAGLTGGKPAGVLKRAKGRAGAEKGSGLFGAPVKAEEKKEAVSDFSAKPEAGGTAEPARESAAAAGPAPEKPAAARTGSLFDSINDIDSDPEGKA